MIRGHIWVGLSGKRLALQCGIVFLEWEHLNKLDQWGKEEICKNDFVKPHLPPYSARKPGRGGSLGHYDGVTENG
jgi:hypothetical protein